MEERADHPSGVETPTHCAGPIGTDKSVPYKETHDLTLLDALRPFHPLRVGEAGGALSKRRHRSSFSATRKAPFFLWPFAARLKPCPSKTSTYAEIS